MKLGQYIISLPTPAPGNFYADRDGHRDIFRRLGIKEIKWKSATSVPRWRGDNYQTWLVECEDKQLTALILVGGTLR
jgi:hypothetical protein